MKKLFNFCLMTGLLAVCLALTACGDDDSESNGNIPTVNGLRLVQWLNAGGETISTFEYNSKGQIIQVKSENTIDNFIYEIDKITVFVTVNGIKNGSIVYSLSNGRVVSSIVGNSETFFDYNSSGYLKSKTRVVSGELKGETQFTWSNGNLVKKKNGTSETTIEYTNLSNVMLPLLDYVIVNDYIEDRFLAMQGYFGKTCRNLPYNIKDGQGTLMYDYTVEQGVVTKLIEQHSSGNLYIYSFIWE